MASYITVQGMMQQEQSSPHQQGSFTPGAVFLIALPVVVVLEELEDAVVEIVGGIAVAVAVAICLVSEL